MPKGAPYLSCFVRGEAGPLQVPDAHIALCSNGGAGALFTTLLILGDEPR